MIYSITLEVTIMETMFCLICGVQEEVDLSDLPPWERKHCFWLCNDCQSGVEKVNMNDTVINCTA